MKHDLPYWYEPLKKKYPVVTDAEWALLNRLASVKHIQKGDSFLRYGKIARYSAFVISGLFKFSIQDEESDEKIIRFGFPTDFLANCESYNKKAPSAVNITALEDAIILKINIKKLQPLYDLHMNLLHVNLHLYREISEQQSEHQHLLSLKSPLGRYRYLLERRPVIIQKVTLTNIARYLYISREALSRARLLISK